MICLESQPHEIPSEEYYEGFPQLENGVGLMRSFEDEVLGQIKNMQQYNSAEKKIILATGTLAYEFMERLVDKIRPKFLGLHIQVLAIVNNFFGDTITVSGLITGGDLIEQTKGLDFDTMFIPRSMMKSGEDIFLDNIRVEDLEKTIKAKIVISEVDEIGRAHV